MSDASLELIISLAATLFAPQASSDTFLTAQSKLYHRHLHKNDWIGSPVTQAAPGSIEFIVLSCQTVLMFRCVMQRGGEVVKADEINANQRTGRLCSDTSPNEFYRGELK